MNSSKIVVALLAGVAIGAALGVFLTSEKGSELRNDVAEKAKDFFEKVFPPSEQTINEADVTNN